MMKAQTMRILERYEETLMGLPYPIVLLDAAEEIGPQPRHGVVAEGRVAPRGS
jgi:hypothetical protein